MGGGNLPRGTAPSPPPGVAEGPPRASAESLARIALYHDYHGLHGELFRQTPAERDDGTPFSDLGVEHVPGARASAGNHS